MKITARSTLPEFNITANRVYEVVKKIESPEIGTLYQIMADDGKLKNLRAQHFMTEEDLEVNVEALQSALVEMHRRQYLHNKAAFEREIGGILTMMTPNDGEEAINIEDIREFLEQVNEYLMAMMFHINSLHVVGLKLAD